MIQTRKKSRMSIDNDLVDINYFTYIENIHLEDYLKRNFDIYNLEHIKKEINHNNLINIGFLCVVKEDRLNILINNINNWTNLKCECYLFFSNLHEHNNIINYINKIKENELIIKYKNKIKYIIYKYVTKMEDSSGVARVSSLLFFNNLKIKDSIYIISDDRRILKFEDNLKNKENNFKNMLSEIKNNTIVFPKSQRSNSMRKNKTFNKKKNKIETTYNINKLGQIYILNDNTLEKICNNKEFLKCLSAPIFEDYILMYLSIDIYISRFCYRHNYGYQESISRKNLSEQEINDLFNCNNSRSFFLKYVLDIIISNKNNDKYIYNSPAFPIHLEILNAYLKLNT